MKNSQKDTETRGNAELIHFEAERFRSNSVDYIIGVDEAGRGPLAGPVVAASCCFVGDPKESMNISEIRDSKLITDEKEREIIYEKIINHPKCLWDVSIQSNIVIDEINILQATMKAMHSATSELLHKHSHMLKGKKILALIIIQIN